jgi:hypothetical protein
MIPSQLRIVPDLFHEIYPHIEFADYYKFHLLNKKCHDIVLNHNIIHKFFNKELTNKQLYKYGLANTWLKSYDVSNHHVPLFTKERIPFVDILVSNTYKNLLLEYSKRSTTSNNYYIIIDGDIIYQARNDCEAILKYIKYQINESEYKKYFLEYIMYFIADKIAGGVLVYHNSIKSLLDSTCCIYFSHKLHKGKFINIEI